MNHRTARITILAATVALAIGGCAPTGGPATPSAPTATSRVSAGATAPAGSPGTSAPASAAPGGSPTEGPTSQPSVAASAASPAAATTTVRVRDFEIDPDRLTATRGAVTAAVTNDGPTVHNFSVRDASGKILLKSRDLRPGESDTASGELPAGSYITFCSLPGHESLGMKGTLVIR